MDDFVAIDFETANFSRNSACSVGVVRCQDGKIVDSFSTLIRPPRLYFHPRCVEVHGLTATDVRSAPCFDRVWHETLGLFLGNATLVAHNASFDKYVLYETLQYYGIPVPRNDWKCSYRTAQAYFRQRIFHPLPNYQLHTVAEFFGVQFHHHDALEDAYAAARIMLEMMRQTK